MKFQAFAKRNGSYIFDEVSNRLKFFNIWDVADLKKNNPECLNSLTFYSTNQNEANRSELIPVIKGSKQLFYRYKHKGNNVNNTDGDNETISHHLAILAISELATLHFVIRDEKYTFNVKRVKNDYEQIKFENGNVYIPDIIIEFSESDPLYSAWGGKIALEIMVNHFCTDLKRYDFERHNLPIIEIKLAEKMQYEKYYKELSSENADKYLKYLKKKFSSAIFGKILSNPMQTKFARKKIQFLEQKNEEQIKMLSIAQSENGKIHKDNETLKNHVEEIEKELNIVKGRLERFNNRNIFSKVLRAIFCTPSA